MILLLATGVVSMVKDVPIELFMRDTTVVARVPFYFGAISNIGILLWCATASMCLLTSGVLHRVSTRSKDKLFFLGAALITSVLMIDDLFLVHEALGPLYLALPSDAFFVSYGVLALAFFLYYYRFILHTDYILLLLGMVFLAGSVVLDLLADNNLLLSIMSTGVQYFLEDGFKLLGIAGWFSYFGGECFRRLVRQDGRESTTA
jgi:hypothetical protein